MHGLAANRGHITPSMEGSTSAWGRILGYRYRRYKLSKKMEQLLACTARACLMPSRCAPSAKDLAMCWAPNLRQRFSESHTDCGTHQLACHSNTNVTSVYFCDLPWRYGLHSPVLWNWQPVSATKHQHSPAFRDTKPPTTIKAHNLDAFSGIEDNLSSMFLDTRLQLFMLSTGSTSASHNKSMNVLFAEHENHHHSGTPAAGYLARGMLLKLDSSVTQLTRLARMHANVSATSNKTE